MPLKKNTNDFKDILDDNFQNCFLILKLGVYSRHLKMKLAKNYRPDNI